MWNFLDSVRYLKKSRERLCFGLHFGLHIILVSLSHIHLFTFTHSYTHKPIRRICSTFSITHHAHIDGTKVSQNCVTVYDLCSAVTLSLSLEMKRRTQQSRDWGAPVITFPSLHRPLSTCGLSGNGGWSFWIATVSEQQPHGQQEQQVTAALSSERRGNWYVSRQHVLF